MIYSADFKEMAGKINVFNIIQYLLDLGWKEVVSKREYVKIFQFDSIDTFFQVDLPGNKDLKDYNMAMYRAIETIAKFADKSVEQVLLELINPLSDILRIRISDAQTDTGSILVEDAVKLYDNAKKLLAASAMDVTNPKLFYLGKPSSAIQEFIANCRFGQTEIGSYVVSLVCPFSKISNNRIQQLSLFNDKEDCANSLTRNAVNKLITSIKVVKESVDKGILKDVILNTENEENLISSSFLEALSAMNIYRKDSELEISVKYASTITSNKLPYTKIAINHDYYEPIEGVISSIRLMKDEETSFIGRISKMQATPDLQKRKSGVVTLVYIDECEKKAKAQVNLSNEDYNMAVDAHMNGKNVKITGALSGLKNKRIDCSAFEVID